VGAYRTAVVPAPILAFANAFDGWQVDGLGTAKDNNLSSSPIDVGIPPGTSIRATTDGGSRWTTVRNDLRGIWGVDLVAPGEGYAIGVTTLQFTADGGKHWQQRSEPAGHPLVWAQFSTSTTGYGLTTPGTLVHTVDGGASWAVLSEPAPASAACFSSDQSGYLLNANGDVYGSTDNAQTWHLDEPAPPRPVQYVGPVVSLACDSTTVAAGLTAICAAACGDSDPYLVERSIDSGRSWVRNSTGYGLQNDPVLLSGTLGAIAVTGTTTLVAAQPDEDNPASANTKDIDITTGQGSSPTLTPSPVPALPQDATTLPTYYETTLLGFATAGGRSRLAFDTSTPGKGANQPHVLTPFLWTTADAGGSWTVMPGGKPDPGGALRP
jgi:photosystem II stability/assembly factor-like uncharacterized protein